MSVTSAARPKIADYPFTTLHPNLGVVGIGSKEIVVADIPGLIEGAHEGVGLGTRFLGHVERTSALLHLVDATDEDVVKNYNIIRNELISYGGGLAEKPELIALSKCDALEEEEIRKKKELLSKETGQEVWAFSSVSKDGLYDVLYEALKYVEQSRIADESEEMEEKGRWQP